MSRVELTVQDGRRIDQLMHELDVEHGTCGPAHDPYGMDAVVFDVRSPLARFLMRKGVLKDGAEIGVAKRRYYTTYEIEVAWAWAHAHYSYGWGAKTWRIRRIAVG